MARARTRAQARASRVLKDVRDPMSDTLFTNCSWSTVLYTTDLAKLTCERGRSARVQVVFQAEGRERESSQVRFTAVAGDPEFGCFDGRVCGHVLVIRVEEMSRG